MTVRAGDVAMLLLAAVIAKNIYRLFMVAKVGTADHAVFRLPAGFRRGVWGNFTERCCRNCCEKTWLLLLATAIVTAGGSASGIGIAFLLF
jgi:hypothetical protein